MIAKKIVGFDVVIHLLVDGKDIVERLRCSARGYPKVEHGLVSVLDESGSNHSFIESRVCRIVTKPIFEEGAK